MLRTESFDLVGRRDDTTVTKLDDGVSVVNEVRQTRHVRELVGPSAISVLRGPRIADARGEELQEAARALDHADAQINGPLRVQLAAGAIMLLRCSWLVSDAADAAFGRDATGRVILKRRQDMPAEAFLSPADAAKLFDRGDRSVLVLSHCWQTALHPDPHGTTLEAVRRYLRGPGSRANVCALFIDFCSLPRANCPHQPPMTPWSTQFLTAAFSLAQRSRGRRKRPQRSPSASV